MQYADRWDQMGVKPKAAGLAKEPERKDSERICSTGEPQLTPAVDHSLISPSGKMSKQALEAAQERTRRELFGDGLPYPTAEQPPQEVYLRRKAKELRELAARGMKPRSYLKLAKQYEQEADLLLRRKHEDTRPQSDKRS